MRKASLASIAHVTPRNVTTSMMRLKKSPRLVAPRRISLNTAPSLMNRMRLANEAANESCVTIMMVACRSAFIMDRVSSITVALRESKFAWAELLRQQDRRADAVKLYRELAADVRSKEGSAAAYYVLEDTFEKGDMDKTEKAIFAYSEREPLAYWLAKAFILLATSMSARETISRRGRPTRASRDGYSPARRGIVDEAKERIAKLN